MVPLAHASQPPNGVLIGWAIIAWLMHVFNRQTDGQTPRYIYDICRNGQHQISPSSVYTVIYNHTQAHKYDQFWNIWVLLYLTPLTAQGQIWQTRVYQS